MRSRKMLGMIAGCVLALAIMAVATVSGGNSRALTFVLVDALTGAPVTNAQVFPIHKWTDLPVEKLRLGLRPFRRYSIQSSNGIVRILRAPEESRFKFSVVFIADGYHSCTFERTAHDALVYPNVDDSVTLAKTNEVRISLKRKEAWKKSSIDVSGRVVSWDLITNGLGIRYERGTRRGSLRE